MSKPMTVKEVLAKDSHFKYQLLSRMEMDCRYYLSNGDRNPKYLWAQNKEDQITFMKEIWKSFDEDKKPEWISLEEICRIEELMHVKDSEELKLLWFDGLKGIGEAENEHGEKVFLNAVHCDCYDRIPGKRGERIEAKIEKTKENTLIAKKWRLK